MDIIHIIQTAPLIDIIIFFALFAAFILGMLQGAIRRIIGIASMVVAFILAANLRGPVGDYLADNWTQFPRAYNHLLAFAITFCVLAVASSIVAQGFYKRQDIYAKKPVVDDVLGGILGVVQGLLVLGIAIVIFTSYSIPNQDFRGDPYLSQMHDYMRQAQDLLIHQSWVAGAMRDHVLPAFVTVLSPLLPVDITNLFR